MSDHSAAQPLGQAIAASDSSSDAYPSSNLWADHRGPLSVDDDFSVLDDPMEQEVFTRPVQEAGVTRLESILMVQGMYCAACSGAIEGALERQAGVSSVEVQAVSRRVTIRWDPARTQLSALARAVGQVGYRLLPMQQAMSVEERRLETRKALWRLFVAGFCMMQVMMYAWPSYVTEPGEIPDDIHHLLQWASLILSLPVLIFSSRPFFDNAWAHLKQGRIAMDTPVSIGILACFFVSVAATYEPTGPWGSEVWYDSLVMFVFFLLGARFLEFRLRDRTAGALDALMNRLPEQCERQRPDGSFETVSLKRLQVGDVVRIQAGQAFVGDGTVLSEGATVDEALLTGESHPVTRLKGQQVIAGSFNLAGTALMRIDRLGRDTRFSQIVSLMEQASTEKPGLVRLVDRIAAPFLGLVMLSAVVAFYIWWQIDPAKAFAVAVAILIVTCPCALSLATPSAMLAGAGALARRGTLVRRLQAFEALLRIDTVVFDKTGTLTQDRVVLREVLTRAGVSRDEALSTAAGLAVTSMHPVSQAIIHAMPAGWQATTTFSEVQDVPGAGLVSQSAEGRAWRLGSARHCGLSTDFLEGHPGYRSDTPCTHLVDNQGWVATFMMDEGVRPDAAEAVAKLQAMGIKTLLLSGDRLGAARRVASQVGIEQVVAEATPDRKLEEVVALQQQGRRVAMVGDGINDGPVLARADVAFALGHGAPLTQSQSDFVVQSGRLSEVLHTVQHARKTMSIVHQNLCWAAGYNAISVPMVIVGWMPPWAAGLGMALSSFIVIGNAMRLGQLDTFDDVLPPDPSVINAAR